MNVMLEAGLVGTDKLLLAGRLDAQSDQLSTIQSYHRHFSAKSLRRKKVWKPPTNSRDGKNKIGKKQPIKLNEWMKVVILWIVEHHARVVEVPRVDGQPVAHRLNHQTGGENPKPS